MTHLLFSARAELLKPSQMDSSPRKPCLPGTRTRLLEEIIAWATRSNVENNVQNVLWLHGMAGSGKSTIATTIAQHFDKLHRQGAYLFFERATSTPSTVIRTLANQLALFDTALSSAVSECLNSDPKIAEKSLRSQFEELLQVPLAAAAKKLTGPVIIVLDALDECGDRDSRRELLEILGANLSTLPSVFRWLITSRPEEDIRFRLGSSNSVMSLESMVGKEEAILDVQAYLQTEMKRIRAMKGLPHNWPRFGQIYALAQNSEGLFIWASTACKLIEQASRPTVQLATLLSDAPEKRVLGLDVLYATALKASCSWRDTASWDHFKSVMTIVLFSRDSVNDDFVDQLLGLAPEESSRLILSSLSSLFSYTPHQHVRPLHASFRDYLMDEGRSGDKPWSLAHADPEQAMVEYCLRFMSGKLRFNICNIPTSYEMDGESLLRQVKASISPQLRYACRLWIDHLVNIQNMKSTTIDGVQNFSDCHFLSWLEVMNICGVKWEARDKCLKVKEVVKVSQI